MLLLIGIGSLNAQDSEIILKGHSHNDYTRPHPLYDALKNRFFSVEVDLFHVDGKFLVAHTKVGIREENTLQRLYLEPLQSWVEKNGGKVYPNGPLEFVVMIDLKGSWSEENLSALEAVIFEYQSLFTVFHQGNRQPGAVRLLLSGSGVGFKNIIAQDDPRYFSIDGRLEDINSQYDKEVIPRISARYGDVFNWRGFGKMPEDQKKQLQDLVREAHFQGRKIRFWATPHRKKLWKVLLNAGVDWINVDDLEKFRKFYLKYTQ